MLFSKPVANLMAWNVIIADWSYNLTDYMIVNKEHNGFLQEGSLLSFDMMGHTIGEPPQVSLVLTSIFRNQVFNPIHI